MYRSGQKTTCTHAVLYWANCIQSLDSIKPNRPAIGLERNSLVPLDQVAEILFITPKYLLNISIRHGRIQAPLFNNQRIIIEVPLFIGCLKFHESSSSRWVRVLSLSHCQPAVVSTAQLLLPKVTSQLYNDTPNPINTATWAATMQWCIDPFTLRHCNPPRVLLSTCSSITSPRLKRLKNVNVIRAIIQFVRVTLRKEEWGELVLLD